MSVEGMRGRKWLSSVGVHRDELSMVLWMTALFTTTQASHGVGANAADALFFDRYGVEELPLMILLSGPAVMVAIGAHSAGLARRGARRWLVRIMALAAVWVSALWASVFLGTPAVYPVIWISTQALIYLTLTVMWNSAGAACTTRQAKRLFPVFATAAVAGGVAGNLMVGPLASLIGTQNLLLIQALLVALATLLVQRSTAHFEEDADAHGSVREEMGRALSTIRSSPLLKLAAAAISLLFALFYVVVFPFSEAVTAAFATETEIAAFLGLFSSVATAATFLFSLLVTGRLFSRLGLMVTLLIVPLVYLVGFSTWLLAFGLITAAAVRGAQWVAVNAAQTTSYSALFNVVSSSHRGPVMSLMTAVPAQLGTMAAGVILIFSENRLSPRGLFMVGIVLSAAAVAVVAAMRPAYLTAVVAAVRRGLVGLWDTPSPGVVNPVDRDVVRVLEAHLSDPRPRARAIAASGLAHVGDRSALGKVQDLLDDEDPLVRAAAFESVCQIEPGVVEAHLVTALADESSAVRLNALRYVAATGDAGINVATFVAVLDDLDPRVRAAAAWLTGGEAGEAVVREMLSTSGDDGVLAVLEEVVRHPDDRMGVDPTGYLDHDDPRIRAVAGQVHGALGADPGRLVPGLEDRSLRVRRAAAESLARTAEGRRVLVGVLQVGSVVATEAALDALTPYEERDAQFTRWAAGEASRAAFLSEHRRVLAPRLESPHGRYLVRVLGSRVDRLIQWVIMAMTTPKTRDVMPVVARGVHADDPETNAQAVEALESVGDRSVLSVLIPLLEPGADDAARVTDRDSLEALAADFDPWLSGLAIRCLERDFPGASGQGEVEATPEGPGDVASLGDMPPDRVDTLDAMGRILVLQRVPMFSELDPEDLMLVAGTTSEVHFDSDELVFTEGEPGNELLVIADGTAVVSRVRNGQKSIIETFREGQYVGELSLLSGGRRSADVHSGRDGLRALVVGKADLFALLEERPSVAIGMLGTLAGRLVDQT
jgi:HEAT repeat protein